MMKNIFLNKYMTSAYYSKRECLMSYPFDNSTPLAKMNNV